MALSKYSDSIPHIEMIQNSEEYENFDNVIRFYLQTRTSVLEFHSFLLLKIQDV